MCSFFYLIYLVRKQKCICAVRGTFYSDVEKRPAVLQQIHFTLRIPLFVQVNIIGFEKDDRLGQVGTIILVRYFCQFWFKTALICKNYNKPILVGTGWYTWLYKFMLFKTDTINSKQKALHTTASLHVEQVHLYICYRESMFTDEIQVATYRYSAAATQHFPFIECRLYCLDSWINQAAQSHLRYHRDPYFICFFFTHTKSCKKSLRFNEPEILFAGLLLIL